jgi:hypothetical protein
MNNYFGKAQALASIAETELNKAEAADDKIQARQAAGKAWLAVGEAFRGLLLARGIDPGDMPRSERGRVFMHTKYGSRKLRQLYHTTKAVFHQDAYYEEIIDYVELQEAREAMRHYIAEAQALAQLN